MPAEKIDLKGANIRHFKLSSSEEIVAIVDSISDTMIMLEHPMRVNTTMTERGFVFYFSSWQPMTSDRTCYLNPIHIISHVECSDEIKEKYIRMCIEEREFDSNDKRSSSMHQRMGDSYVDDDPDDLLESIDPVSSNVIH